jgi:membrane-associated phospholipid phosphatase
MQKIQTHFANDIIPAIKKCTWYFSGLLIILSASAFLLLFTGKAGSFIFLNSYHPFLLNVFFINYTFLGDGIFASCLILFFFYRQRKQQAFALLVSFLISGIAVQVIKNFVSAPRPKIFFETGQYLYFINGVSHGGLSSFPSGHTATAFAIATVIVMIIESKKWQLLVLSAAVLVGYSRIYLAQHFLMDVITGALIGNISGILSVYLIKQVKGFRGSIHKIETTDTGNALPPHATVQTA